MGLSISRLQGAVRRVEEIGAIGGVSREEQGPSTIETHWVQISSSAKTAGRYPGNRYDFDAQAQTYTAKEAVWVDTPNDEKLSEDVYYLMRLVGVRTSDGVAIYQPPPHQDFDYRYFCVNGTLKEYKAFADGSMTLVRNTGACCDCEDDFGSGTSCADSFCWAPETSLCATFTDVDCHTGCPCYCGMQVTLEYQGESETVLFNGSTTTTRRWQGSISCATNDFSPTYTFVYEQTANDGLLGCHNSFYGGPDPCQETPVVIGSGSPDFVGYSCCYNWRPSINGNPNNPAATTSDPTISCSPYEDEWTPCIGASTCYGYVRITQGACDSESCGDCDESSGSGGGGEVTNDCCTASNPISTTLTASFTNKSGGLTILPDSVTMTYNSGNQRWEFESASPCSPLTRYSLICTGTTWTFTIFSTTGGTIAQSGVPVSLNCVALEIVFTVTQTADCNGNSTSGSVTVTITE